MNLKKKIALNTIYQVIGRVITILLALIIVIYLTRYLGVAGYGNYTTIVAYLGVFTIIADFGFYLIAAREISQNPQKTTKIFNNTLTIRIITAIGLLLLANLVVLVMPYSQIVKVGIWIFSLGILAMLINQVIIVLFQINLATDKIALGDVLGRGLTLILVIWAIKSGGDLRIIMWTASAGFILNMFFSLAFALKYIKISLSFDFSFWKKLFFEAWPIGIVIVLLSFYFRMNTVFLSFIPLDHVIIPSLRGLSNTEAIGFYGPPYRVLDATLIFPAIIMGIVMPIFARFLIQNIKKAQKILTKSLDILVIIGVGSAFLMLALSPPIISLMAGVDFERSIPILQILGFYMASFFVIVGINYFVVALGKQKELVRPYLYVLGFNIVLGVIGVYLFSYIGAAVASLIINLILMIFGLRVLAKSKFQLPFSIFQKSLFAGIIMVVLLFLLNRFLLINASFPDFSMTIKFIILTGLVIFSLIIYFGILYLLKAITIDDLKLIWSKDVKSIPSRDLE